MKKWITIITMLLLFCCPATAFAAETNTAEVPSEQGIAVYGRALSSKDYYEIVLGEQGADAVQLPDGVTLSGKSDASEDNDLHVIIIPVTAADEADAYAWMTAAAKDPGKDPTAYYLLFYRENGLAQPNGHITVTAAETGKNSLRYMDGNAAVKELPCSLDNAALSFEMAQSGFYIMASSDSPSAPILPDGPKTGDTSHIWVYLSVMSASALVLIFLWRGRKKAEK